MTNQRRLPGTKQGRHRARRQLTAQETEPGAWLVTGGEIDHRVVVSAYGKYRCDCGKQAFAKNQMCSHCLCVWMARGAR